MRFKESEERAIRKNLSIGITSCLKRTFHACTVGNVQEPDIVAMLTMNLPKYLYRNLYRYFPQYQCAVSGIFCHQKPLADMGKKPRPEIGDLLLIYMEDDHSVKRSNALLLQAKITDKTPYTVPQKEEHQLKLYEEWPKFAYARAGALDGNEIDIRPKTLHAGAQYLLLEKPCDHANLIHCASCGRNLYPDKGFADAVIDLMKFQTGRTFQPDRSAANGEDWSSMIWDLIEISGVATFNRTNTGMKDTARLADYGDMELIDSVRHELETKSLEQEDYLLEDDRSLISAVIVCTKMEE